MSTVSCKKVESADPLLSPVTFALYLLVEDVKFGRGGKLAQLQRLRNAADEFVVSALLSTLS